MDVDNACNARIIIVKELGVQIVATVCINSVGSISCLNINSTNFYSHAAAQAVLHT